MKVILLLSLVVALASCSQLRHYQKVAADPFRNEPERALLSQACNAEFPAIRDTPKVVYSGVDSSDYLAVALAYNQLIDSLIAYKENNFPMVTGVDSVNMGTSHPSSQEMIKYLREYDSLRVIKGFLRNYHPPAVIKTEIKEVPIRNTSIENTLQSAITNCRNENAGLIAQAASAKTEKQKARTTNIWLYIVGGILLTGNLWQMFSKKKLLV